MCFAKKNRKNDAHGTKRPTHLHIRPFVASRYSKCNAKHIKCKNHEPRGRILRDRMSINIPPKTTGDSGANKNRQPVQPPLETKNFGCISQNTPPSKSRRTL